MYKSVPLESSLFPSLCIADTMCSAHVPTVSCSLRRKSPFLSPVHSRPLRSVLQVTAVAISGSRLGRIVTCQLASFQALGVLAVGSWAFHPAEGLGSSAIGRGCWPH